jgi:hypothetical protein
MVVVSQMTLDAGKRVQGEDEGQRLPVRERRRAERRWGEGGEKGGGGGGRGGL